MCARSALIKQHSVHLSGILDHSVICREQRLSGTRIVVTAVVEALQSVDCQEKTRPFVLETTSHNFCFFIHMVTHFCISYHLSLLLLLCTMDVELHYVDVLAGLV